ncbi:cell wall-active antibiotics response protein LiaF [Halalkalibacterium ligniniphilum]|uniref:cell wall-active antibiotics response protein LiaF n=1 Tax=Halalkalibacterium ligniniphilum TaxID=1134413 RepID=UPI000348CCA4|nr:cell wall-active antibiotics response protein LiaF [Halalkalibacterium ligniniphilum]
MSKQTLLGIIIVMIGLTILLEAFRFSIDLLVIPLIFLLLGLFFYRRQHRLLSIVFFILGAAILFDRLFHVNLFGLLFAGAIVYYGVKLLGGKDTEKQDKKKARRRERKKANKRDQDKEQWYQEEEGDRPVSQDETFSFHRSETETKKDEKKQETIYVSPSMRRSLIGEIHYVHDQFELQDTTIWNGIGDVKMDFSKAIIPEGETVVIIQEVIGNIHLFVPEDLAVSIQASTWIGEISLFQRKQSGFNQTISIATKEYKQSPRRLKLVISTGIGEVKVRAV